VGLVPPRRAWSGGCCRLAELLTTLARDRVGVPAAPGVQRVVDEAAALQQPLVVGLRVQAALTDRQQPRPERIAVEIGGDVGGVHDAGQPRRRRVAAEVEGVDEDLEGAAVALVGELALGVSRERARFRFATSRTWSAGTYRVSAAGSMTRRISQGRRSGRSWDERG
jgi:hypothetical protein